MKQLPCACNKERLHEEMNGISRRLLQKKINETIALFRSITVEEAKNEKKVTKKEAKAVMVAFGEIDE